MKTAIRMDDITPDMDFGKFNKVKDILDAAGIKPLIGVVPYSKDETLSIEQPHENFGEFVSDLQKQGWVIALHGYNHLYTTSQKGIFPINEFSEFAGVEYDKQYSMISKGLRQLNSWGLKPVIFMAPGHTFDDNTLKALLNNGITKVTDGFGKKPYIRAGVTFYPISKKRSECTNQKTGYSTYVLHTNTMSEKGINDFKQLIENNRENFIDYSEYLNVEAHNQKKTERLAELAMVKAKYWLVSKRASRGTVIHNVVDKS